MNERFRSLIETLDAKYHELLKMPPVIAEDITNDTPVGGIYLFSEGENNLYAGRTERKIAVRVRDHFARPA